MSGRSRADFVLHLRQLVVAAAYREAARRAEEHTARGHRLRARRAAREAEQLHQRLEQLGGVDPTTARVRELVAPYLGDDATQPLLGPK